MKVVLSIIRLNIHFIICSSTKILKGIEETARELNNSLRSDSLKSNGPDQTTLNIGNESISMNKSILDETLMPENEDEEDMIIDSDDIVAQQRNSASKVSTMVDLLQLFQDVWYIIYGYTCRYAISLGVQLGSLPQPIHSELPAVIVPKKNTKHLNQLVNGVIQLTKSLSE